MWTLSANKFRVPWWGGFEARRWRSSHLNHRWNPRESRAAAPTQAAVSASLPIGRHHDRPAGRCQSRWFRDGTSSLLNHRTVRSAGLLGRRLLRGGLLGGSLLGRRLL